MKFTMRAVIFLCVCACYVVVGQDFNGMNNMPKYDSRYDYLDLDAILDSKRLVKNYVECLVTSHRCAPEGKALKRILPEALRTKCVRCTERQKKTAVKVIRKIKTDYPEEWEKLAAKWDPTGDFTRYFEDFLAKELFNTIDGGGSNEIPGSSPPPPQPPVATYGPPPPAPLPPAPSPPPRVDSPTSPPPMVLNRFGDEGELMVPSPSSGMGTPPSVPPMPPSMRPAMPSYVPPRPTPMSYPGAASDAMPTRFPLRPFPNMHTTAITFIDQIGFKIMRTTELVTDILRNTVRAVVGR